MKIECLLKRIGGTEAEIGGITYHFAEQADGKHVAEVTNQSHIDRFLSIREGYREASGTKTTAPKTSEPVKAPIIALNNPLASDTVITEQAPATQEQAPQTTTTEPVVGEVATKELTESSTEQDALIAEAKALGIRANRNWGIARLQAEIAALKAVA